jgi:hypothetical protein
MKNWMVAVLLLASIVSGAQDRFFAHTYTTNVLPKGNIDLELWHTSRIGHQKGAFFHGMDQRMEFEVGLGKNVQTAFYFNRYQQTMGDSVSELTRINEIGFSNEWKWKLSDPSVNRVGLALYGELGLKGDEVEWEGKIILDKYVGKSLFALNIVGELEQEVERENGEFELESEETPIELDAAYMYNFNKNWGLGFELVDYNGLKKGDWEYAALYGGPTVNYRADRWFLIANFLPQWKNLHKTAEAPGNKVLGEHERSEARILVGFSF